ncbi:MAG TPA: carbohydrate ABC transporter permease [Acetobacteraceae bacterium]|nr:carbohydrate ABC transporter permease [Acetobacteraceae bacterium]
MIPTFGAALRRAIRSGFALFILLLFLSPVFWMLITAIKPPGEWLNSPPIFWPSHIDLGNFAEALVHWGGFKGLVDSLAVASGATALSLVVGIFAAYSLGRFRTGGENLSFTILSVLFMPPVAVAVPMYLFWRAFGLLDSFSALILQYTVFNVPFICWVLKSFFEDIDPAMEESALVNGATRWQAFLHIALPQARPAIVAVALLSFIFSWNEFFFAVILTRARVTTLPVILPTLMEGHDIRWGSIAAIASIAALPVICLAFALQRYLVRGLSFGALR